MFTKRNRILTRPERLSAFCGLIAAVSLVPLASRSGVRNSAHDFSKTAWSTRGDLCMPCHASHEPKNSQSPLWNKSAKNSGFKLYSSPTMMAVPHQPSASSKACLGCHDGTVAMNSFGGKPGNVFMRQGPANLGTDLSNDHPISILYDTELAKKNRGLYDPSIKTVPVLRGQTIQQGMLIDNFLECASCHDVHASKGQAKTADKMLLVSNDGSALCLTCHNK